MRIKISGGRIVDGTGRPGFVGDVVLEDGKIAKAGGTVEGDFDFVAKAEGRVVAPGFIDTHSHSDLRVLADPQLRPKIFQGITTEVYGQDGISLAPLPERYVADWRMNIAGLDGDSNSEDWDNFRTTGRYLETLRHSSIGVNTAYLAPHGNVRMEAMGLGNRAPTQAELDRMKDVLRRELDAGALGLSTGLIYIPCAYAQRQELIELCRVVAEADGVFVVHQRSEADNILTSMREVLEIGRQSGARVHFSHFKICGRKNWRYLTDALMLLDRAAQDGVRVSFDQYPYAAGSTMLGVILPPWAHAGGTEHLLERLRDPGMRRQMKKEILAPDGTWDNFVDFAGFEGICITSVKHPENEWAVGKNLAELGKEKNRDPLDAAFDLLLEEDNAVGMIDYYGNEEDLAVIMRRPEQNFCTDGLLGGRPHPRVYGAFPRVLGRYVRGQRVLTLEQAIAKMTGKSAAAAGIVGRGLLKPGYAADVVVFDPETVLDESTYEDPCRYPDGIDYVFVNGRLAVERGEHTGALAGQVLTRKGCS